MGTILGQIKATSAMPAGFKAPANLLGGSLGQNAHGAARGPRRLVGVSAETVPVPVDLSFGPRHTPGTNLAIEGEPRKGARLVPSQQWSNCSPPPASRGVQRGLRAAQLPLDL